MFQFAAILAINLGAVLGLTFALWLVSLKKQDASIIDLFWGLGFAIITWVSATLAGFPSPRAWLVVTMASLWGLRLSAYLTWRNWGEPEDRRYGEMRKRWGQRFWIVSLFTVFWLQVAIMWVVSLPLQFSATSNPTLNGLDAMGVLLWAVGIFFEAVGDWQLARFKSNPDSEGEVFDGGLWRYTRHPNYFGDFLVWWGFGAIALASGGWWTLVGPFVMTILLLKFSGVALLEKSMTKRRPEYRDYIERTSAFVPWPPKSN